MAVPLWASNSPLKTKPKALVLCGSSCPRQSYMKDKVLQGLEGVHSKEPPALVAWLRAPLSLRISPLSSLLPPAQISMVAPTSHATGKGAWGEEVSHPYGSPTSAVVFLNVCRDCLPSFSGSLQPVTLHTLGSIHLLSQLSDCPFLWPQRLPQLRVHSASPSSLATPNPGPGGREKEKYPIAY